MKASLSSFKCSSNCFSSGFMIILWFGLSLIEGKIRIGQIEFEQVLAAGQVQGARLG